MRGEKTRLRFADCATFEAVEQMGGRRYSAGREERPTPCLCRMERGHAREIKRWTKAGVKLKHGGGGLPSTGLWRKVFSQQCMEMQCGVFPSPHPIDIPQRTTRARSE
jgi:hypothetical protein